MKSKSKSKKGLRVTFAPLPPPSSPPIPVVEYVELDECSLDFDDDMSPIFSPTRSTPLPYREKQRLQRQQRTLMERLYREFLRFIKRATRLFQDAVKTRSARHRRYRGMTPLQIMEEDDFIFRKV